MRSIFVVTHNTLPVFASDILGKCASFYRSRFEDLKSNNEIPPTDTAKTNPAIYKALETGIFKHTCHERTPQVFTICEIDFIPGKSNAAEIEPNNSPDDSDFGFQSNGPLYAETVNKNPKSNFMEAFNRIAIDIAKNDHIDDKPVAVLQNAA